MTNRYFRPEDATHEWKCASYDWREHRYYKKVEDEWYSFSPTYQVWSKSKNEPEWFAEETKLKFFREITTDSNWFAEKNKLRVFSIRDYS